MVRVILLFAAATLLACSAGAQPRLEDLTLIGTVIRADAESSMATISAKTKDSRQNYFRKAKVPGVGAVKKIEREKVTLVLDSTKEEVVIRTPPYDPSKAVKSGVTKSAKDNSNHEYHLPRMEIDAAIEDLPKLVMEMGTSPVSDGKGGIDGFRVTFIKPGSIFSKLGLSESDIIQEVNGQRIRGVTDALELFSQLRDSSLIKVQIGREKKKIVLTYLIR